MKSTFLGALYPERVGDGWDGAGDEHDRDHDQDRGAERDRERGGKVFVFKNASGGRGGGGINRISVGLIIKGTYCIYSLKCDCMLFYSLQL